MTTTKIHIIEARSGSKIVTRCGKTGYDTGVLHEWDTAGCDRFSAVPPGTVGEEEPTCLRCTTPRKHNPKRTLNAFR